VTTSRINWLSIAFVLAAGFGIGWFCRESLVEPINSESEMSVSNSKNKPTSKQKESASKTEITGTLDAGIKVGAVPQTAQEVLERLLVEIESSDSQRGESPRLLGRLQQLQDFGEEGSKAIRAFLDSQQDIVLSQGFGYSNGRLTQFPSVRAALLDTLYEMRDPTAQAACLNVLKNTSSGLEALLAARNLEKMAPGVHRADALTAVTEILSTLVASKGDAKKQVMQNWMSTQALEIVGYYQAREVLPQLEELVKQQPQLLNAFMNTLLQFPAEEQISTMQRLSSDPKLARWINQSFYLGQMDYQSASARQAALKVIPKLTAAQKQLFLQQMAQAGYRPVGAYQLMNPEKSLQNNLPVQGRVRGSIQLLEALRPSMDTPVLKKQLEETRKLLAQQIK
jgi:hypothetical protein